MIIAIIIFVIWVVFLATLVTMACLKLNGCWTVEPRPPWPKRKHYKNETCYRAARRAAKKGYRKGRRHARCLR